LIPGIIWKTGCNKALVAAVDNHQSSFSLRHQGSILKAGVGFYIEQALGFTLKFTFDKESRTEGDEPSIPHVEPCGHGVRSPIDCDPPQEFIEQETDNASMHIMRPAAVIFMHVEFGLSAIVAVSFNLEFEASGILGTAYETFVILFNNQLLCDSHNTSFRGLAAF
jgi:hypothetical protein